MEQKYNYYLFAAVILLSFAAGLYILNGNKSKSESNKDNDPTPKSNVETNPVGQVHGEKTQQYDPNMLPADTPESANKYVLSKGDTTYTVVKKFIKKPTEEIVGINNKVSGIGWFDSTSNNGSLYVEFDMKNFETDNTTRDRDILDIFNYTDISISGIFTNLELSPGIVTTLRVPLDLNINGVHKMVEFEINVDLNDDRLMATGKSNVKLSDFGVTPPSLLNIYSVDDNAKVTFEIEALAVNN